LAVGQLEVPAHTPDVQTSLEVQALLSEHTVPFAEGAWTQLPVKELQLSMVQGFASSQLIDTPAHTPLEQTSLEVQVLLSLHDVEVSLT
jgi:hypothetical protein